MRKIIVTFQPEGTRTEALPGEKLIDIASYADIDLNNLCSGQGICGKCRVKVNKGKVKISSKVIGLLSRKELEQGYVLACQAESQDEDIEIWIPPESRHDVEQIQIADYLIAYDAPTPIEKGPDLPTAPYFRPLCQKYYLELPPPTIQDSLSDLDRIYRELRKKLHEYQTVQAHFSCLWGLGQLVRKSNWKVTATVHFRDAECPHVREIEGGNTSTRNYGVAIDVGTTTIVAQLVDLRTGAVIGVQASHNSQARYGEDVISRMIYAVTHSGLTPLTDAVVYTINSLVESLVTKNKIRHEDITSFVSAGNTVMSHLLLGLDPGHIRMAPYIPIASRFPQFQAAEAGLKAHPKALLHCMPCVSSYVGGDITAGVLACGMNDQPEVSVLIDVGTNGEIVIGNNEWLVCCSSSAGPAFEGGGIKCGMRAIGGAIEKVRIKGDRVFYDTISKKKPIGLCGSAIIDAIAELLSSGIIDQSGKFANLRHPRIQVVDDVPEFIIAFPAETETGEEPIVITEDDVSNLIKSKGAVLASMRVLLNSMSMEFMDLERIFVAGGFGAHLDIEKAILIGLLPDVPKERIRFIGNSSLAGARLALLSTHAFHKAEAIANRMTYFELSVNQDFMNEFVASLFLPHTDMTLFPSVRKVLDRTVSSIDPAIY
ncbi:MAG: ASKHA domain-containing protein [Syntrophobacteraceae bacterium]